MRYNSNSTVGRYWTNRKTIYQKYLKPRQCKAIIKNTVGKYLMKIKIDCRIEGRGGLDISSRPVALGVV